MALTDCLSAGCGLWKAGAGKTLAFVVSVRTRASGAAGVQTHTRGPPKGGHYVRAPLLSPWRRMIFNRLD